MRPNPAKALEELQKVTNNSRSIYDGDKYEFYEIIHNAAAYLEGYPLSEEAEKKYICSECGVSGVKLWRESNTFADEISLLCVRCAEEDQSRVCELRPEVTVYEFGRRTPSDQIGWMVPAVPTINGDTYWGYTSVPQTGCLWWKNLPLIKE